MIVVFRDEKTKKLITNRKKLTAKYGKDTVLQLARRINLLEAVDSIDELVDGRYPGNWEWLLGDRAGQASARLSGGFRLVVEPGEISEVVIIEIVNYH